MSQSIISVTFSLLAVICFLWKNCEGQLAFHTDSQTNSFSLKAPGYQQTFTRYFGGQQGGLIQQQTAASQPAQQIAPAPQNYAYQPTNVGGFQQAYPTAYSQQQQIQPQASQQQPQFISAQDYAAFLQQSQQQQAQPLQYTASPQYEQQLQASTQNAAVSAAPQQQQDPSLLGVAFSPSDQVSHVKFASGGLSYNF